MPRDPVARVNADRRDLPGAIARPNPCQALVPPRDDSEVRQRDDQGLFDLPEEPVQVFPVPFEIDDWVADELSGSVKRDVAASLDLEQLDAARGEQLGTGEKMLLLRRASERHDGRVLDEEQDVFGDFTRYACTGDAALVFERFGVGDQAEMLDQKTRDSGLGTRDSGSISGFRTRKPGLGQSRFLIKHESSSRANPAPPRRPLRTASGARESPGRLPPP